MAEPVSAQERLDKIVVLIAANMVAEVCSVYVLRVDAGPGKLLVTWTAVDDVRDCADDAAEDLLERHRLIVVIADTHRVCAGVDRLSGQRGCTRQAIVGRCPTLQDASRQCSSSSPSGGITARSLATE